MFKMAVSFSNSWYDVTPGLALAEQLKLMTFAVHALSFVEELVNWTFSGLSRDKRHNLKIQFRWLLQVTYMYYKVAKESPSLPG